MPQRPSDRKTTTNSRATAAVKATINPTKGKSKPPPTPAVDGPQQRKVVYPAWAESESHLRGAAALEEFGASAVEVLHCYGPYALTAPLAVALLWLETERVFRDRMWKKNPQWDEKEATARCKFSGEEVFTDHQGMKIMLWNSDMNRPFEVTRAYQLEQIILNRQWAGPTTSPGETVNGEPIIIGRTAQVISGQHTLVGLYLAYQSWLRDKHWQKKEYWPKEQYPNGPVIDKLVVRGVSENPRIVQTIDNIRPRSLGDVIYTSDTFRGARHEPTEKEQKAGHTTGKVFSNYDRKECGRMLAMATSFLWKRTVQPVKREDSYEFYATHPASIGFIDRHHKLEEAVLRMFHLNQKRVLSGYKLSPGQCAAALYMMACSTSNGSQYRALEHPGERILNWDRWDRAVEFWTSLAKAAPSMKAVPICLGALVDEEGGASGRSAEKFAVIAHAWAAFVTGGVPQEDKCRIQFNPDSEGVFHATNLAGFGGIDLGPKANTPAPQVSEKDVAARKREEQRKKDAQRAAEKIAQRREDADAEEDGAGEGEEVEEAAEE